MAEEDEALEDVAATLLNGVMIFLIGTACAALVVWQAVTRRDDWAGGLDLNAVAVGGGALAVGLFGFLFIRSGVRTIRKSLAALHRRWSRSPTG